MDEPRSVLVVEDDRALRQALERQFRMDGWVVLSAGGVGEAVDCLLETEDVHLVLTDIKLPDGSGIDVVRVAAARVPTPTIIAMTGCAQPSEAFELARAGAHEFVEKPFDFSALRNLVESRPPFEIPDSLKPQLARILGEIPLHELEERVRELMVLEALARSDDSRTGAARLLGVSRQALQKMTRRR